MTRPSQERLSPVQLSFKALPGAMKKVQKERQLLVTPRIKVDDIECEIFE